MDKKKIALIAAGVLAPVGIYFRKQIFKVFKDLGRETMRVIPRKLTQEELERYERISSPNSRFELAISKEKNVNGQLVGHEVLLLQDRSVYFSHLHTAPEFAQVTNNGTAALFDRLQGEKPTGMFVYTSNGTTLLDKHSPLLPYDIAMDTEGRVILFALRKARSAKTVEFLLYLPDTDIIHEFSINFVPEHIAINSNGKYIELKDEAGIRRLYSLPGEWLNRSEYEKNLLKTGNQEAALDYFLQHIENAAGDYMNNQTFLGFLEKLKEVEAESGKLSRDTAFLFRRIGEYYEEMGNKQEAIKYYELALQKYERVGVKMKLKELKDSQE